MYCTIGYMRKHKLYVKLVIGLLLLVSIFFLFKINYLDNQQVGDSGAEPTNYVPYTQKDNEIEAVVDPTERYQRYVIKAQDLQGSGTEDAYQYFIKAYEIQDADVFQAGREEMIYTAYKDASAKGFSKQAATLKELIGEEKIQIIEAYLSKLGGDNQ
jgi:hypothetical protein